MLLNGLIMAALLSALLACKSTENSLSASAIGNCADAGLLERVLGILQPSSVASDRQACIPMVITSRNGNGVPSQSNNNTQNRAFQAAFQGARQHIRIQTPNFNDDAAIRGLGAAVRRGVKVEMVQSKLFNCETENQFGQGGQNEKGIVRFIKEFGASAAQGPLHDIRWFTMIKDGKPVRVVDNTKGKKPEERPNNSHAKFMAVDDELVIVGSANMDTQSWNQSRELNVMVFHPEVTKAWQNQVFQSNFAIAQPVAADELIESKISCDML